MKKPTKFIITETDEFLTSHSGLAMIGALTHESGLAHGIRSALPSKKAGAVGSDDSLISMIGLLSLAKPDFTAIEQFRDDDYFQMALGLKSVPSEPTLRQRIDEIADNGIDVRRVILQASANLLHKKALNLTPCHKDFVAIDGDVSPFDNSGTKKEGVSCTYKLKDGYAPMFAYIGNE